MRKFWRGIVGAFGFLCLIVGILNVFFACAPLSQENLPPEVASRLMARVVFGFLLVIFGYFAMRASGGRFSRATKKPEESAGASGEG